MIITLIIKVNSAIIKMKNMIIVIVIKFVIEAIIVVAIIVIIITQFQILNPLQIIALIMFENEIPVE